MTEHPIRGQVAQILNSRELVINRGQEQGVRDGMVFEVLAPDLEAIKDPETGEVMGSLDRRKVVVKIVQVEPKMAVARTFTSRRVNIGGTSGAFAAFDKLFTPPKYVNEVETLKTEEQTWEDLPESESFVKIGDPIRQVMRDLDE